MYKTNSFGEFKLSLDDEGEFSFWLDKKHERFFTYGSLRGLGENILYLYRYDDLIALPDTFDSLRKSLLSSGIDHIDYNKDESRNLEVRISRCDGSCGYITVESVVDWNSNKYEYARKQVPWFDEKGREYSVRFEPWNEKEIGKAFDEAKDILKEKREQKLEEIRQACDFIEETSKAWGYNSFRNPFKSKFSSDDEKDGGGFLGFLSWLFK